MYVKKHSNIIGDNDDDLLFYCPLLKKEIYDGDCYEIVHCGYGELKKNMHPEIVDWQVAALICKKCGRN